MRRILILTTLLRLAAASALAAERGEVPHIGLEDIFGRSEKRPPA